MLHPNDATGSYTSTTQTFSLHPRGLWLYMLLFRMLYGQFSQNSETHQSADCREEVSVPAAGLNDLRDQEQDNM